MDDDGWSVVKPYLADHPIAYPVVVGTSIADAYRVMNMPMTLLIDRHGRVALSHVGIVDKAKWETGIRQLLDESPR
jgi:cytochrome c biogenesis protein CcmG/thiol:disulfide interchange protein DsbE